MPLNPNKLGGINLIGKTISTAVIHRLPRYYRYLSALLDSERDRISSNELGQRMNLTASQIRQDLNLFGGFGQQGYGYSIPYLHAEIGKILGLNELNGMIIIGAGNLGQALANKSFDKNGFDVKGIFDINPNLIGLPFRGIEVQDITNLKGFLEENNIKIAVLALNKEAAPKVVNDLISYGVKAFWNFVPMDLEVPDDIVVENVHLSDSLMTLSYRANNS